MSQENVELLRSRQDDWNRGDTTVDPERFHPDLEYLPRRAATEGAYRGLAGLERWVADTLEVFEKFGGIFEFRDGKVVRWQDFGSKDKALEAVGLSEPEAHADS